MYWLVKLNNLDISANEVRYYVVLALSVGPVGGKSPPKNGNKPPALKSERTWLDRASWIGAYATPSLSTITFQDTLPMFESD